MTILPIYVTDMLKSMEKAKILEKRRQLRQIRLQNKHKNYANTIANTKKRKIQLCKVSLLVDKFYINKITIEELLEYANSWWNYCFILNKLREKLYNSTNLTLNKYNQLCNAIRQLWDIHKIRSYELIQERHKNLKKQIIHAKSIPWLLKPMNNNPKWYR